MEKFREGRHFVGRKAGEVKDSLFPTRVHSFEDFVQVSQAWDVSTVQVHTETIELFDHDAAWNGPLGPGFGGPTMEQKAKYWKPFFVKTELQTVDQEPGKKVVYSHGYGERKHRPIVGSDEYLEEVKTSEAMKEKLLEQMPGIDVRVVLPGGQEFEELVAEADRRGLKSYF